MFIEATELKTELYRYQVEQISDNDDTITQMAIAAAEQEVRSYLNGNPEGTSLRYNTKKIFEATGAGRNALIVSLVKDVAVWHFLQLCQVDVLFSAVRDRYDRAIDYLKRLNKGSVNLDTLPLLTGEDADGDGQPDGGATKDDLLPFRAGSRPKFDSNY